MKFKNHTVKYESLMLMSPTIGQSANSNEILMKINLMKINFKIQKMN